MGPELSVEWRVRGGGRIRKFDGQTSPRPLRGETERREGVRMPDRSGAGGRAEARSPVCALWCAPMSQ